MAPILIFEDTHYEHLYPLTLSRPAVLLRCGGLTLLERMTRTLAASGRSIAGLLVRPGLAETLRQQVSLPVNPGVSTKDGVILVNGRWLMLQAWQDPAPDSVGLVSDAIAWMHLSPAQAAQVDLAKLLESRTLETLLPTMQRETAPVALIQRPWDLLGQQRAALEADFRALGPLQEATLLVPGAVHLLGQENIHLARGVKVYPGVVLDAERGPIVIEEGTEVRANTVITGPAYIGKNCLIRAQAEIREDTTLGPGCRVGGEVLASIFLGRGNKQHHGFLGQTIVGEWTNLGAGTTTSNLKNTYGMVRMPINGVEVATGRQFLGAVIADHAKLGSGTYLPVGAVVGFASQVMMGRPPKFVPSFAWVTESGGIERTNFEKVETLAKTVMARREVVFTPADHELFVRIAGEWSGAEKYAWK